MHSPDLTQDNIAKIRELFPGCVTESPNNDGSIKLAVDFDQLRQELSESIVEGPQERYHLNWPGKREAIITANAPIAKTFRPSLSESVNFDETQNLFIEGDNLDALKLLQETYLGRVQMIYIDPPYNTGNDFVYEDDFSESTAGFLAKSNQVDAAGNRLVANTATNGRFHSDWLSMMYARIRVAQNLLHDEGIVFVSIDEKEVANLRKIMDEVFGAARFIGNIAWESKTKSQNTTTSFNKLQPRVENILVYSKDEKRKFNLISKGEKIYSEVDNKGQFRWFRMEPMSALGIRGRETMIFSILGVSPPEGKQWQIGEEVVSTFIGRGDVLIRDGAPYLKMRPEDERNEITQPFWGFFSKEMGTAESAKAELGRILDKGSHGFETVKPVSVIQRLVFHATSRNDIVLDFFAGSGTTAHACIAQNAEDGEKRQFILVQLAEETQAGSTSAKAGYTTIAEISKERIRRVGVKTLEGEHHPDWNKDVGFRVLKIDTSNMADVYYTPDATNQADLLASVDSIKQGRTAEDLLFQVLVDWGVDLTLPICRETVQGKTVFFVDENALVACFDTGLSEELVKELAGHEPVRVVFRDTGFVSDAVKINVEQIFRQLSPSTEVKAI